MAFNKGRMITNEELQQLAKMNTPQRLKYIREELNKLFPREFSKRSVVDNSEVISYQGLHYLEEKQTEPKPQTVKGLAKYYDVPEEVFDDAFYSTNPEPFFIGKKGLDVNSTSVFKPEYELEIHFTVRRDGKELVDFNHFTVPETIRLELNYLDLYGLLKEIENKTGIINDINKMAENAFNAFDILTKKKEAND
jgi:transcriptional regulator with XRE-family HTH domain